MVKRRKRAGVVVLALAAAGVLVLPASPASAVTFTNACQNSVTANASQLDVNMTANSLRSGSTVKLSNITQSAAVPGDIFIAGYNLGLLTVGVNNIPANLRSVIAATNTVEGVQNTNVVGGTPPNGSVTVSTTITDPTGGPGTGDETATDGSFSVSYSNQSWTAASSGPVAFREDTVTPLAANVGGLIINARVGIFPVQFRCSPGTVTGPDPGVIAFIDPAPRFDTPIQPPRCAGRQATTFGTNAKDKLSGTKKADVIAGLGGNDVLRGLAGNDVICGGKGRDRLVGGPGRDRLLGEAGADTLRGGPGRDILRGGPGRDLSIQ